MSFLTYGLLCPFCFSLGNPWPICLPWASSAFLLTLYSHGLLLTSLGFLGPITSNSSLGFMGLPSIPFSFCLHCFEPVAVHSYFFFTSYTAHGFATCYFSLSGLFWAHLLSQGLFTYFMDLWSIISIAWT